MELNQIIQGDCFDVLPNIPDNSIDMILTDPPYCTTDLFFDKEGFSLDIVLHQFLRILKPNGYIAIFAPVLMQAKIANIFHLRFSGAWVKPAGTMRTHSAKKPMNQWELYCVFSHPDHRVSNLTWNAVKEEGSPYKKVQRYNGFLRGGKDQLDRATTSSWTKDGFVAENDGFRVQTDVIYAPNKPYMAHRERTKHPTQKPLKVISVLIQWLTNEGDIVLDPFSGSGTTAIACKRLNRQFLAIEKEREFYEYSVERLNGDVYQPELPVNHN